MRRLLPVVLTALLLGSATACDPAVGVTGAPEAFDGTYVLRSYNGSPIPYVFGNGAILSGGDVTARRDGTLTVHTTLLHMHSTWVDTVAASCPGRWARDGDRVNITFADTRCSSATSYWATWSEGNTLTWTFSGTYPYTLVYRK